MFVPSDASQEELDRSRPLLRCTTFDCLTVSHEPLIPCPRCESGVMGINCSVNGYQVWAGSPVLFPAPAASPTPATPAIKATPQRPGHSGWELTCDLVCHPPFVASKEDVNRGLDLRWKGSPQEPGSGTPVCNPGVSVACPMQWCERCSRIYNQQGKQPCPLCGDFTHQKPLTYVTASPENPSERLYWPLGTFEGSPSAVRAALYSDSTLPLSLHPSAEGLVEGHHALPWQQKCTGAASSTVPFSLHTGNEPFEEKEGSGQEPNSLRHGQPRCIVTDSLEVHFSVGPMKVMELLRDNGIFSLEDAGSVACQAGPEKVSSLPGCTQHAIGWLASCWESCICCQISKARRSSNTGYVWFCACRYSISC